MRLHAGLRSRSRPRTDRSGAAGGDWIAQRVVATGTHEGEFTGVEATGERVEFEGVDVSRPEDGGPIG